MRVAERKGKTLVIGEITRRRETGLTRNCTVTSALTRRSVGKGLMGKGLISSRYCTLMMRSVGNGLMGKGLINSM